MPPTRKDQDKAAWGWADITDPNFITKENILTAYRVKFTRCKSGSCRRNCRGNPYCLYGLGELSLIDDSHEPSSSTQNPENEKRGEGLFVGLKNLGATCYVNSLLQLWFHNPVFRNAIFDWEPRDDPDEISNTTLSAGDDYVPQSVVGHLQRLFSLLKFSKCRYIDPTQFVEALGLDTTTQQDAQEFSKLFISLLENRLSYQTLPHVRDLIINNFRGKYSYVTRCCKCQTDSVSPSLFYELELHLKGHHTLAECLTEFLKEERLDGANCYHCAVCNKKEEALRFINLQELPPVLNLQLLRFVFDRHKGYKKKVTSAIQFPMILDMGEYLVPKPQQPCMYNLTAVLIHKGLSANSGHYVAHIQNTLTNEWHMFNDENVQKREGKKLELSEDDDEKVQKGKKRLPKGFLKSNNAYMLVYTAENYKPEDGVEKPLHARLEKYVQCKNKAFDDWYDNVALSKKVGIEKKEEKLVLHSSLSVPEDCDLQDIDMISVDWLTYWLQNTDLTVKPIDNSKLQCLHLLLDPDQIVNCKYISSDMATELYDRYGGGPRLQGVESFCDKCVFSKCLVFRTKAKTWEESKEILNLLKQKMNEMDSGYFVSKNDLRTWRKRVLDALGENPKSDNKEDGVEQEEDTSAEKSVEDQDDKNQDTTSKPLDTESDESDEEEGGFNESISCIHGKLSIDESARRLVPDRVWEILSHYFPEAPTFRSDQAPCQECQNLASKNLIAREQYQEQASAQKNELRDLVMYRNRPQFGKEQLYVIPTEQFYEPWKKYVRSDGKKFEPPKSLYVDELLCSHGCLKYSIQVETDRAKLTPVTIQEWDTLNRYYPSKHQVVISTDLITNPGLCDTCFVNRLEDERKALLDYNRAKVFIRYTSSSISTPAQSQPQNQVTEDGDSSDSGISVKRLKLNGSSKTTDNKALPVKAVSKKKGNKRPLEDSNDIRRSSRRRRVPGEKEVFIFVSSSNTLRDLKCKIMSQWAVAPYDQHLTTTEGRELLDDQSTLANLGVLPNTVLLLRVDEPSGDGDVLDDLIESVQPEAGFKGTELLRNF